MWVNIYEYPLFQFSSLFRLKTHLPLMPHICVSESVHHWFRRYLVAGSAPSHYLNQHWVIVNCTLSNKLRLNFNHNTKLFIHKNASENDVCENCGNFVHGKMSSKANSTALLIHSTKLGIYAWSMYCWHGTPKSIIDISGRTKPGLRYLLNGKLTQRYQLLQQHEQWGTSRLWNFVAYLKT